MSRSKTVRILWYVNGGADDACPRYRAYAYRPFLEKAGVRVCFRNPDGFIYRHIRDSFARILRPVLRFDPLIRMSATVLTEIARPVLRLGARFERVFRAHLSDVVIFQRVLPGKGYLKWLGMLGKRCIYDLDDALFLDPPKRQSADDGVYGGVREDIEHRMREVVRRCEGVLVSNAFLSGHLSKWNPRITLLPTACPLPTLVPVKPPEAAKGPVIGWMGATENQRYLPPVLSAVARLKERYPLLEVRLLTRKHWDYSEPYVRRVEWAVDTYAEQVGRFTVGIAPLDNTPWSHGKMQFKALQYAVQGIPVVATPVGFDTALWRHGDNILFAGTEQEWENALDLLLKNSREHDRIGGNGRETVVRYYSPEVLWPVLAGALGITPSANGL